ncbi:MAG: hypothetical protein ACRDWE_02670 [Acidimicrobiales bacterium]
MSGLDVCMLALLVGGLAPALVLGAHGRPSNRLIGLELANGVVLALFLLFSQVRGFSFELVLPLVLVTVSFAGTLVYTRLLSPQQRQREK